ncbi:MAG TPA: hypothetical protein VGV35_07725 [Bryobacteraceae bacterium]|nr:hypothetical protein [Bryobacteraceae bacterium]
MTDFEDQLRRALERKDPSPDFAARVVARATQRQAPWVRWRSWAAVGIAASLLVGALGLEMEHRQRVRRQGEEARAQLLQAMQITAVKLHKIQKKVRGTM